MLCPIRAGCSLADSITLSSCGNWKREHPGAAVVSYVNTTAEIKAESDYCFTRGNAEGHDRAIPADREILFLPGQFLGLAREAHGREAAHLARRVPRPRRHPAAGDRRGARRARPMPTCSSTPSAAARASA